MSVFTQNNGCCVDWKVDLVRCSTADIWMPNTNHSHEHPLHTLMDDFICVCLVLYVSQYWLPCWFKGGLCVLKCCHIYQSGCVGGSDRMSILLSSFNCCLGHSEGRTNRTQSPIQAMRWISEHGQEHGGFIFHYYYYWELRERTGKVKTLTHDGIENY